MGLVVGEHGIEAYAGFQWGTGQWTLLVPEDERAAAVTTALDVNPETVESKCGVQIRRYDS